MQRIGNDFSKSIVLDLISGLELRSGLYQVSVTATLTTFRSANNKEIDIQNSSWYTRSDFKVDLGQDVYGLRYTISDISSFSQMLTISVIKTDLILLNMASKFFINQSTNP